MLGRFRAPLAIFKPRRVVQSHRQISKSLSSILPLQDTSSSAESYVFQYQPSSLEEVEDVEGYQHDGLHPISIGDTFANGRYKVLHKLGFGGSSTVWLARDEHPQNATKLVTLKVLAASLSRRDVNFTPELVIPQKLNLFLRSSHHPAHRNVQFIEDHFMEKGPNGTHLCLVSHFAGASILSTYGYLWIHFKMRIRGNIARQIAKQAATVIERMHSAAIVHGDITTSNILFKVSDDAHRWSDCEVYAMLGQPVTEEVITCSGCPPEPCAPQKLVEAIDGSCLTQSWLLQESIVVADFGQSFDINDMPKDYAPATVLHYTPPEVRFDSKICFASDVWMLACTIFETRAGHSLFDSFLRSDNIVWRQVVETLGKLPEPWWSAFEPRSIWFDDNGEPKPKDVQEREGVRLKAAKSSIREKVQQIGEREDPPEGGYSSMSEMRNMKLEEAEIELLSDLLQKMLRYRPEDRISMREVIQHPWFDNQ